VNDPDKTKAQLTEELDACRARVAELEAEAEQRERTEAALRAGEQGFRTLIESSHEVVFSKDSDGRYHTMNLKAAIGLGGTCVDDIVGKTDYDLMPKERADALREADKWVMENDETMDVEEVVRDAQGEDRVYLSRKWPTHDSEGKATGIACLAMDITERRQAEEQLTLFRRFAEASGQGLGWADLDGTIRYANPALCRILEEPRAGDVMGRSVLSYYDDQTRRSIQQEILPAVLADGYWSGEVELRGTKGRVTPTIHGLFLLRDSDGEARHFANVITDITRETELEKQLRQAQKMEAIGTLAGGIAHDFNNILTPIAGYTEMAMDDLTESSPVRASLEEVLAASERAVDLVRQILAFSRQGDHERRQIRMIPVVKEALKLLRASLPAMIEIDLDIRARADAVLADPTQIHQVVMNLCMNASHAMRETGGKLTVAMSDFVPEGDEGSPCKSQGLHVRLSVSDTGHGISPDVLERIFDPYFTTKEQGEGTGLGLSVVHGIVESHGGAITVESTVGEGTTSQVLLPVIDEEDTTAADTADVVPVGTERVLFVDDEKALVGLYEQMLGRLGYRVTAYTSSPEALAAFRATPDAFDLVITDMAMPTMTGIQLAREAIQIRPDIPLILCTGFTELVTPRMAKALGIREFLMKPIRQRAMAKAIRRALGEEIE